MKPIYQLIIVLAFAIAAFFFVQPNAWNNGADFLNHKVFAHVPVLRDMTIPQYFNRPFKLGLDLKGGIELTYVADLKQVAGGEEDQAMAGLRDVIERRVNLFGVQEPQVRVSKVGGENRLSVELAGVYDVGQAIQIIGQTPFLEFREETKNDKGELDFKPTNLTGKYLSQATVDFSQLGAPIISLEFNSEGAKIFEDLTGRLVGKRIAIYLDGVALSAPTVQNKISGGKAQITGQFSLDEAKTLVRNLNEGALPVPIALISQNTIGPTLGGEALRTSIFAALIGFVILALFIILYYRVFGVVAIAALLIYTVFALAVFKLLPVTLTLAGIAGFVLSIGMAVDANILIFERTKEEIKGGKQFKFAIDEGFKRAWTSIRDSNVTTLLTTLVLYIFGTSIIQGFALTLAIGVLISMFSAIMVTRIIMKVVLPSATKKPRLYV